MTTKAITDFEEFKSMGEAWTDLVANSEPDILFLTHDWLSIWWEAFSEPGWKLMVILVYNEDQLVGAAPLVQKKIESGGLIKKSIEFLANSHTFRCDFLVSKGVGRSLVIEHIWKYLRQEVNGWDMIKLKDLPTETGTTKLLEQVITESGDTCSREELIETPYLPIESEWDAYFQKRSRNHKKNMRRAVRKMEDSGKMNLRIVNNEEQINVDIEKGLAIENSGWKGEESSSILSNEKVSNFYRSLAKKLSAKGLIKLFFLELDEKPIAFDFCIIYGGRVYALKTAYDEKFAAFSPGQIMQMKELEYYFTDNVNEYDFIGPKMDFKMKWTDELREHWTLYVYGKTWRGSLFRMWNMNILPILRKSKMLRRLRK